MKSVPTPIKGPQNQTTAAPRRAGISFTYNDVANPETGAALDKLDQFTGWRDTKDIHRFNKLKNTFDREKSKAGDWYRKLVNKHAIMEPMKRKNKETGEMEAVQNPKTGLPIQRPRYAPGPTGEMQMLFHDPIAFEKDSKIFHAHTITVKVFAFESEDFFKAGLTPSEIRACAKLLTDIPDDLELEDANDVDSSDIPDDLKDIIPQDDEPTDGRTDPQESAE